MSRLFARILYCGKIACESVSGVGIGLGLMLSIDMMLENANKPLLFRPYFNQGLEKLIPSVNSRVNSSLIEAKKNKIEQSAILSLIASIQKDALESGFSQTDIEDFNDILKNDLSILKENHEKIKIQINNELEDLIKNDKGKK